MPIAITLFLMFLKIGFTSFGGGYGMMSMILEQAYQSEGGTIGQQSSVAQKRTYGVVGRAF